MIITEKLVKVLGNDGTHLVHLFSASEEGVAIEGTIRRWVIERSRRTGS